MTDSPISADAPAPDPMATPAVPDAQPAAPGAQPAPTPQPARSRNAAMAVLERLFQLYPKMFGARFLPLKLGVYQELLTLHPDEFKKEDLKLALGIHARSTRYLESVAAGHKRHDLNGVPVDEVAPEHVHHAIMEVFRRRQGRAKEDARPWARGRLARAVAASGLARDAYMERVNAKDEVSLALLDEVFAELAEQAARSEALRRAYEASGKSVEAFADMYGMDLKTVKAALADKRA